MRHTTILAAITILLSTAALPAFGAGTSEHPGPGMIEVTGVGVATGEPTIATAQLGVQTHSRDVEQALAEASARMRAANGTW